MTEKAKHAIPDEYAIRVGRLIALWATIERRLEQFIWRLTELDPRDGRLLTSRLDVRPKTEIITGLLARRPTDLVLAGHWKMVLKLITEEQVFRNWVVHGEWGKLRLGFDSQDEIPLVWGFRNVKEPFDVAWGRTVTVDDLDTAISQARLILRHLGAVECPGARALLPSPDTHEQQSHHRFSRAQTQAG